MNCHGAGFCCIIGKVDAPDIKTDIYINTRIDVRFLYSKTSIYFLTSVGYSDQHYYSWLRTEGVFEDCSPNAYNECALICHFPFRI
jgi:hypothetical protein